MRVTTRYLNGKDELLLEAETEGEGDIIKDFVRNWDTLTGKIDPSRTYRLPLIILRKDES